MKRSLKLGLAVAMAAAATAVGGVAVADTTTTTNPITLCVGKLGGNVTAPDSDGQCKKLQTAIQVASASDVAALAARADAIEALNHGQITIITSLPSGAGDFTLTVSARGLQSSTELTGYAAWSNVSAYGWGTLTGNGPDDWGWTASDVVDSHGTVTATGNLQCFTGTGTFNIRGTSADDGSEVTSNTLHFPC